MAKDTQIVMLMESRIVIFHWYLKVCFKIQGYVKGGSPTVVQDAGLPND